MRRTAPRRRQPIGAEPTSEGFAHFRVWAPDARRVEVVLERPGGAAARPLSRENGGYFSGTAEAGSGTLYRFALDGKGPFPDPASRFQPQGPDGPSQLIDPRTYQWKDLGWRGVRLHGQVLYELHVGTFTPQGTWEAAAVELPRLADLGVTALELMPVSDFPGRFGWGYDGCALFAPTRLYGEPDDFRRFVDRAHALRLGVILDVVYNHFPSTADVLGRFCADYAARGAGTEWGAAINFDGPRRAPVREFVLSNAAYWIDEFHLDGLRLDATQSIRDASSPHILAEIVRTARRAAGRRRILIVGENEPQESRLTRPSRAGGPGLDALWNDDFHHATAVALTERREAYYRDYWGTPQELLSCALRGFLYQGQFYSWQNKPRGTPSPEMEAARFIHFLENHDQVANSLDGARSHRRGHPGRWRALTALLLLTPQTPMLFQGQEYGTLRPFQYFADNRGAAARAARVGRRKFLHQFPSLSDPEADARLPDPADFAVFSACKLDPSEIARGAAALALHKDLLALRRRDPVFRAQRADRMQGAVLAPAAFVLRFLGKADGDRLLVVNLGTQIDGPSFPEPLLAPPRGARWDPLWSSERPAYGGSGASSPVDARNRWRLQGAAASVLRSVS